MKKQASIYYPSKIAVALGAIFLSTTPNAQQVVDAVVGKTAQISIGVKSEARCNIEIVIGPNRIQRVAEPPRFEATIEFTPDQLGVNYINFKGKYLFRGLRSVPGCEESGFVKINVIPDPNAVTVINSIQNITPSTSTADSASNSPSSITLPAPILPAQSAAAVTNVTQIDVPIKALSQSSPTNSTERLASADAGVSVSSGQPLRQPQAQNNQELREVIVQGYGKDVADAAQNAAQNALQQVVGSFIDSKTILEKRTEIQDGVRKETKNISTDIKEYSQGSIRSFEVIEVTREQLVKVTARAVVKIDDFRLLIKQIAEDRYKLGSNVSTVIQTEEKQSKSLADIVATEILEPLIRKRDLEIRVSEVIPFSQSPFNTEKGQWDLGPNFREISNSRPTSILAIKLKVAVSDPAKSRILTILRNISKQEVSFQQDFGRNQHYLPLHILQTPSIEHNTTLFRAVDNDRRNQLALLIQNTIKEQGSSAIGQNTMYQITGSGVLSEIYSRLQLKQNTGVGCTPNFSEHAKSGKIIVNVLNSIGQPIEIISLSDNENIVMSRKKQIPRHHNDISYRAPWQLVTGCGANIFRIHFERQFWILISLESQTIADMNEISVLFQNQ
jgi:hypothetical protein